MKNSDWEIRWHSFLTIECKFFKFKVKWNLLPWLFYPLTVIWYMLQSYITTHYSNAISVWTGRALVHPELGSSVIPIQSKGGRLWSPHYWLPPGFEKIMTSLHLMWMFIAFLTYSRCSCCQKHTSEASFKSTQFSTFSDVY